MTMLPQRVWMVLIMLGAVSVMGLVLNIPAPNNAKMITTNHQRPIIPLVDLNEGQITNNRERTLRPQQKNATLMIQPKGPISYSLIMRHEGFNSGFKK
jgi:hypothetical protein